MGEGRGSLVVEQQIIIGLVQNVVGFCGFGNTECDTLCPIGISPGQILLLLSLHFL